MVVGIVAPALRIVVAAVPIKARVDSKKLRDPWTKGHDDADCNEGNPEKAPLISIACHRVPGPPNDLAFSSGAQAPAAATRG